MLQEDANNLVENSKETHALQVEAGWYNEYRSDALLIFLIRSEVFELFEAWRKNKYADNDWLINNRPLPDAEKSHEAIVSEPYLIDEIPDAHFKLLFESLVKDTVQDELADIYIRLMDFIGYKKLSFDLSKAIVPGINLCPKPFQTFEQLDYILYNMRNSEGDTEQYKGYLLNLSRVIQNFCKHHSYDLELHVTLKLKYNKFRGQKHGGKKV